MRILAKSRVNRLGLSSLFLSWCSLTGTLRKILFDKELKKSKIGQQDNILCEMQVNILMI